MYVYLCRCGKLFKSELDAQAHAARTQHANFSESVDEIKPLTEEEKKAQLARYMYMYNVWVTLPPSLPLFPPPFLSICYPAIHPCTCNACTCLVFIYNILYTYFLFSFSVLPSSYSNYNYIDRLEEKIKHKRAEREEREKLDAKEREKVRRKTGQEISQIKHDLEMKEARKIAEMKKREKLEEKRARYYTCT